MNRVEFLMQGLEVNEVQASLLSELISDIPNSHLKNFLVFRMKYIEPMMSKELITKTALYEYRRLEIQQKIFNNESPFNSVDDVQNFIETYYKGKDIGYGLWKYYDYVVISLDKDCNMLNKYSVNEYGKYYKLNSEEKANVYEYLFLNQNRIGNVKYLSKDIVEEKLKLSSPDATKVEIDYKDNTINPKILEMIKNSNKTC